MLARVAVRNTVRKFSTVNHRAVIANNYVVLEQMQNATDEAGLAAAAAAKVNMSALPAGLAPMESFLATPVAASATGFQPDPKGWQYMGTAEYVSEEATRDDTFPFMLSAVAAYLLLGVLVPKAIGNEEAKNSPYISRIEGRYGKLEHGHHH